VGIALVVSGFAQQNLPSSPAANQASAKLQAQLRSLAMLNQQIANARSNEDKARGWLELNRQARKFGQEMNSVFPDTSIKGRQDFASRGAELSADSNVLRRPC
jgi:hypothetical protein